MDTFHVQLNSAGGIGGVCGVGFVEGDELRSQKVLARSDIRNVDVVLAFGGNKLVDSPVGSGTSVFPKFDPDCPRAIACGRGDVN